MDESKKFRVYVGHINHTACYPEGMSLEQAAGISREEIIKHISQPPEKWLYYTGIVGENVRKEV